MVHELATFMPDFYLNFKALLHLGAAQIASTAVLVHQRFTDKLQGYFCPQAVHLGLRGNLS